MTIEYEKLAFVLIKPPSKVVSTHRVKNRKEHISLIEAAKNQTLLLYYAHVKKKGNKFYVNEPLIVDDESAKNYLGSLVDVANDVEVEVKHKPALSDSIIDGQSLVCPFCHKKMTSTPGRTLHIKHKHPERYEEYKDML